MAMYSSCVLGVQWLCILAVYWGYSGYVFQLCTRGTVAMYSSCVLGVQWLCILAVYWGYSGYVF